jgi:hypothetical protein
MNPDARTVTALRKTPTRTPGHQRLPFVGGFVLGAIHIFLPCRFNVKFCVFQFGFHQPQQASDKRLSEEFWGGRNNIHATGAARTLNRENCLWRAFSGICRVFSL